MQKYCFLMIKQNHNKQLFPETSYYPTTKQVHLKYYKENTTQANVDTKEN